jgi:Secretion system C-terminal sorting domain
VRCYPQYAITKVTGENAQGAADSLGVACELQGIVYGINLNPPGLQFTLIDNANNGIAVFRGSGNFGYQVKEGDQVAVRGVISQFRGLTQINADTLLKGSTGNALVSPLAVTKPGENTESKLVRISNLRLIDPAQWTTGTGSGGFTAKAVSDQNPADTIDIRIDSDVELYNMPAPTAPFNATGIGSQFANSAPFTSGYQLMPRYAADISPFTGAKEADFSPFVQLWPNPVAQQLLIQSTRSFERLEIWSPVGILMKSVAQPAQKQEIDVSAWPSGTYFVMFKTSNAFWTTRFIKK